MKHKHSHNPIDILYDELKAEDSKYGGRRLEKPRTEVRKKREVTNLKKAWESHEDDFDEHDEFFAE